MSAGVQNVLNDSTDVIKTSDPSNAQIIGISFDEDLLKTLSEEQNNGISSILTIADPETRARTGYKSLLPIDLTNYAVRKTLKDREALIVFANQYQTDRMFGGFVVNLHENVITFPTTETTITFLNSKVNRFDKPNPPDSVNWQIGLTNFITIERADFIVLATAIEDFVQGTFDFLADTVIPGIINGTIATESDVKAQSWPENTLTIA